MADMFAYDDEDDLHVAVGDAGAEEVQPPLSGSLPAPTVLQSESPADAPRYADQDGAKALSAQRQRRESERLEAFRQEHVNRPPILPSTMKRADVMALVDSEALRQGVNPRLAHAVADAESSYNPHALSPAKAKGVMQLMDGTAKQYGVQDSWNPEQNIAGGMKYLKHLEELYPGRTDLQLAAYNAGEGAVKKYGNTVPPYPETQNYVNKIMNKLGQPKPAQLIADAGPRVPGAPFKDILPDPKVKPAQIAAPTSPLPPGAPWVDIGVDAPGAIAGNLRSLPTGFFRVLGSILTAPGSIAEIVAPLVPQGVADVASSIPIGGVPLGALTDLWQGLGEAAQAVSASVEVPEVHKTFANKFVETAGGMLAYVLPAFLSGGSTLVMTGLESFSESNDTYRALEPIVGREEAAKRAGKTLAVNLVVLGITNKLGIGRQAATKIGKVVGGAVGEVVQEEIQYDTQRRQFWLSSDHPKAKALQAYGWIEGDGRVYQPFSASTAGEIALISGILGGGVAYMEGMRFAHHATPEVVQTKIERIQAEDTKSVSVEFPESVVREGYGPPPPSTPELALPQSVVRHDVTPPDSMEALEQKVVGQIARLKGEVPMASPQPGDLKRVHHGTRAGFPQFEKSQVQAGLYNDEGENAYYFAEDPQVAGGTILEPLDRQEGLQRLVELDAELRDLSTAAEEDGDQDGIIAREIDVVHQEIEEIERRMQGPTVTGGYASGAQANVRPVYLDIRKPFDTTQILSIDEKAQLRNALGTISGLTPAQMDEALRAPRLTGKMFYGLMTEDEEGPRLNKAALNQVLRAAGYDGIFHIGRRDGRVWIAFLPEQVIPAFELDALMELSRAEVQGLGIEEPEVAPEVPPMPASAPTTPRPQKQQQVLGRWRRLMHAEMGAVAFPGGGGETAGQPSLEQRIQDLTDRIETGEAFGDDTTQLVAQRDALTQQSQQTAPITQFTTTMGSTYAVEGNQTQRTKAARPDHPGDEGLKTRSERTVYLPDVPQGTEQGEPAGLLGGFQTHPAPQKGVVVRGTTLTAVYYDEQIGQWRKAFGPYEFTEAPAVGLAPVELWKAQQGEATGATLYTAWHPGNQIIAVSPANRTAPQALPQTPPALPTEGLAELRAAEPSALAQSLEATQVQGTLNLRDAQGRWRIPRYKIPGAELELQDFIGQKNGINLENETDMPGELKARITRAETGVYGLHNDRSGQSLQAMAELAEQYGFIPQPEKQLLLNALERSVQGQLVYSRNATGIVPGISDPDAEPDAPRPRQPAPPITGPSRSVVVLTDAQQRMQRRAESLSTFLPDDRVEFRLPNGQQRQGRIVSTDGPQVTVQYGSRKTQFQVDVLDEASQPLRLRLTAAQLRAEAGGIIDLPQVLTEQVNDILSKPDREITGRITGINYAHLTTPNQTKQFVADILETSAAYVREMRRDTISRTELMAMAKENIEKKRFTIDMLLQREPGELFSPENLLAARLIGVSVAEELSARVSAYTENPTPQTEDAMLQFFTLSTEIFAQWSGLAAETGRALGAFAPDVDGELHYIEKVGDRLTSLPMGITTEEFAEHLGGLKTRPELLAALVKAPTWGQMFLSGLYGVKLMSFTTDGKNVLGSAAAYLWKASVRGIAANIPGWAGGSGEVAHGEAMHGLLYGWLRANQMLWRLWGDLGEVSFREHPIAAVKDIGRRTTDVLTAAADRIGFDTIYERLKTEGLSGRQTITGANVRARAEQSGPIMRTTGKAIAGAQGSTRSAMVDMIGGLLHFSGAKLNTEDLVAKVYNYMGEGYAQAYRAAMTGETLLEGEALSNWMDDYVLNMKGTIKERAMAGAFEDTLSEKLGPQAANIENVINNWPALRLFILFFRTPMNAARWAVRNGALGRFAQKNQEMIARGGADADIAHARIGLGTAVMTMTAMYGLMGLMTGSQPDNRESRRLLEEEAKQPANAVWVPGINRWFTIDWADPVSTVFLLGAELAGLVKHSEPRGAGFWEAVGFGAMASVGVVQQQIMSRTWLKEFRELIDTIMPRASMTPETQLATLERLGMQQVRSLTTIPPVRQLRRAVDPIIRETYTMLDVLKDQVPWLSATLPISYNKLGYPRQQRDALGPDFVSPAMSPNTEVSPVNRELGRLISGGYLTIPDTPRVLKVGQDTIVLTAQEVSDLTLAIAGRDPKELDKPGVKDRRGKLEKSLQEAIKKSIYTNTLSDIGRGDHLHKIFMAHQESGRQQFLAKTIRLQTEERRLQNRQADDYFQPGKRPRVGQ